MGWSERSQASTFVEVGNSMKADELGFCEDRSDADEEVGVARAADVRITTNAIVVRTVYIKS
jgi:hypothetical protein